MTIEETVFARKRPLPAQLAACGFCEAEAGYRCECDFMDGAFRAVITVDKDGAVRGSVIDALTDEEYLPLRAPGRNGAYVNTVRSEYEQLLRRIADGCFTDVPFVSGQANRITAQIFEKYHERPDFPWKNDTYAAAGVFRHRENSKWYALLMRMKQTALEPSAEPDSLVDVLNVKIDKENGDRLRSENGIYRAYHMNRTYWVSVVLNDTLSDARILALVDRSYALTQGKK